MKPDDLIQLLQDVWVQSDGELCKAKVSFCWVLDRGAGYMAFDQLAKERTQERVASFTSRNLTSEYETLAKHDAQLRDTFRSRNAARGRKLPYDFLATPTYEVWLEDVLARHEQDCQTLALLNSTQPQIVIHNQGIKMHSTELIKILQENPGEVFVLDGEYTEYIGLAEVELMRVIDIEGRLAAVSKEERQSAIDLKIYEDELVRVADFTRVKAVLEARNAERGRQDHGIPATFKAHQNLIKCFTPKTLT